MRPATKALASACKIPAAALIFIGLPLSNFAQAQDTQFAKVGWWSIGYTASDEFSNCSASARFKDETLFDIAQPLTGWQRHPNLLRGANSSRNKNRGRLQVQIRRAFLGHPLRSSSEVYDFTHARCRALKKPIPTLHRYSVWRILREIADPIGHSLGPGRPWLWRLKQPAADTPSAPSD
jgi:hypothetical protein